MIPIVTQEAERALLAAAKLKKIVVMSHQRYNHLMASRSTRGVVNHFDFLLVDEAQNATNLDSNIGKAIYNFLKKILLISGTPVRNNLLREFGDMMLIMVGNAWTAAAAVAGAFWRCGRAVQVQTIMRTVAAGSSASATASS